MPGFPEVEDRVKPSSLRSWFLVIALLVSACGGGSPTSPITPPPPVDPPVNTVPTIDGIAAQGRRPRQPARFADLREVIEVSAAVRDPETPVEEMTYQWSATAGKFDGSGRSVTWTAPDAGTGLVTITLKLTENYGYPGQSKIYKHEVTSTVVVRVHDSTREIGDMAFRFLDEFSHPQTNKDWQSIMRDFKGSACPQPVEADNERGDVISHYTNYFMNTYNISTPSVNVNFASACPFRGRLGDACVAVQVYWDSTNIQTNLRVPTIGIDHLAAVYANDESRWWLCSSDFQPTNTTANSFYSR